jgi:hypothetical protein
MIGATMTPTGMPAAASFSTASSRRFGMDVRGSITRCSFSSRVVMDRLTASRRWAPGPDSTSMSRVTRWFFVMMAAGLRNSASTSRQPRVMRSLRSTGWYGSVTPLTTMSSG